MADVDTNLAASLRQAKSKPMFFAFVAKGTDGKLLVGKKKVSPKEISDAKKECGGGIIFKGRCQGDEGRMVFEVGKEVPGTLTALTKKIIKQDAGLTLAVEYRFAADLAAEENTSEEGDDAADVAPPIEPQPPMAPPVPLVNEAAVRFAGRLKALAPVLQQFEKVNKDAAGLAKGKVAEGNQAYLAKKYDEANAALDQAETLIKQGLSAASSNKAPPSAPPPPVLVSSAEVVKRLNSLSGSIKVALTGPLAGSIQTLFARVNGAVKSNDFSQASQLLDELEKLLTQSAQAPGGLSVMKLGKARQEWITTRLHAVTEIKRLQAAIEEEFKDDDEQKTQLANALKRLDALTKELNEDLDQQLDAVLNAQEAQRPALARTARETMKRFTTFVETDELMVDLDGNEILSDLKVTEPLRVKLKEIAAALG